MRKWEDIVKDKLEEPEEALPESVFAEFHDRLDALAAAPSRRRFPVAWALASVAAAGLAAIFFLRQPAEPENGIQIVRQPTVPVVFAPDTAELEEPVQAKPLIAQAAPKTVIQTAASTMDPEFSKSEKPGPGGDVAITPEKDYSSESGEKVIQISPTIPQGAVTKSVNIKVATAAGMVAGGGLLAALVDPALGSRTIENAAHNNQGKPNGNNPTNSEPSADGLVGKDRHCLPVKIGLSTRFPLSDRWNLTTGIVYSAYRSTFTYAISGEKQQWAHYLGVPIRLDWTMASDKWIDVYLGGGLNGDYCLAATLAGDKVEKDGPSLSALAAGGIQFNVSKRIGLYVEPEVSWTFLSGNQRLETYRTAHPFTFSVATGVRLNLCR